MKHLSIHYHNAVEEEMKRHHDRMYQLALAMDLLRQLDELTGPLYDQKVRLDPSSISPYGEDALYIGTVEFLDGRRQNSSLKLDGLYDALIAIGGTEVARNTTFALTWQPVTVSVPTKAGALKLNFSVSHGHGAPASAQEPVVAA